MKFLVMPPLTPKDFHFIQRAHGLVVPLFISFAMFFSKWKPQTWVVSLDDGARENAKLKDMLQFG